MLPCGESFSFEKEKEWPSEPALAIAKYLFPEELMRGSGSGMLTRVRKRLNYDDLKLILAE